MCYGMTSEGVESSWCMLLGEMLADGDSSALCRLPPQIHLRVEVGATTFKIEIFGRLRGGAVMIFRLQNSHSRPLGNHPALARRSTVPHHLGSGRHEPAPFKVLLSVL